DEAPMAASGEHDADASGERDAERDADADELTDLRRAQGLFGPSRMKREKSKRQKPVREKMPRTPGSRLRTMAILGGAEGEILDRVPGETPRFVQMFFVLA